MKAATLRVAALAICLAGDAVAQDQAPIQGVVGRAKELTVVEGAGGVVEARLVLRVVSKGSNDLTFLCERGQGRFGASAGACVLDDLFKGCRAMVAEEVPRGDGLTETKWACGSAPLGACLEVSGYLLGPPQTEPGTVAVVVDSLALSETCGANP